MQSDRRAKLGFVCGCLEPGRDGVGDYVINLAKQMSGLGFTVVVIALYDKYVHTLSQGVLGNEIQYLRIPKAWGHSARREAIGSLNIAASNDWLSIQYVPYSFDDRGLPWRLLPLLRILRGEANCHFMFHELWVGLSGTTSPKRMLLRFIQRHIADRLLRQIRPAVITTTTDWYAKHLPKSVGILPLFGNMPIATVIPSAPDTAEFRTVYFGKFPESLRDFISQLLKVRELSVAQGKIARLITVGNGGPHAEAALLRAREILGDDGVEVLGRLPDLEVSAVFQRAQLGLSRVRYPLLGKSGTAISMLEHGLPLLLAGGRPEVLDDPGSLGIELGRLVFCEETGDAVPGKQPPSPRLPLIAALFDRMLADARLSASAVPRLGS